MHSGYPGSASVSQVDGWFKYKHTAVSNSFVGGREIL